MPSRGYSNNRHGHESAQSDFSALPKPLSESITDEVVLRQCLSGQGKATATKMPVYRKDTSQATARDSLCKRPSLEHTEKDVDDGSV